MKKHLIKIKIYLKNIKKPIIVELDNTDSAKKKIDTFNKELLMSTTASLGPIQIATSEYSHSIIIYI